MAGNILATTYKYYFRAQYCTSLVSWTTVRLSLVTLWDLKVLIRDLGTSSSLAGELAVEAGEDDAKCLEGAHGVAVVHREHVLGDAAELKTGH